MAKKRPFHRTDRLNSQVKEVLALTLLQEAREAILREVVITDVEVTNDLSLARVYWHSLPGAAEAERSAVDAAFQRANGYLRKKVGEAIRARHTPELRFIYDAALDRGRRIDDILVAIARETPPPAAEPGAPESEDDEASD